MNRVRLAKKSRKIKRKNLKKSNSFTIIEIALFLVLAVLAIILKFNFVIILLITYISAVISYHINMFSFQIDTGHYIFFSLVLARLYGINAGLIMIFFGRIIPLLLSGKISKETVMSAVFTIIITIISVFFTGYSFVLVALILVGLKFMLETIIGFILGVSTREFLFETLLIFVVNYILIIGFGDIVLSVLG